MIIRLIIISILINLPFSQGGDHNSESHDHRKAPQLNQGVVFGKILNNETKKPVEYIEEIIANAQKNEFETKQFSDYKDQFQWFIGLGILFLLIDVFFLDKKTKWVKKIDLFNEQ